EAEAAAEREQEKQTPATPMPLQPTAPSMAKPSAGVHHPLEKPVKLKIAKGRLALVGADQEIKKDGMGLALHQPVQV
ncbi:hypothetical protein ACC753_37890, partial [Rhizobium ruizarguesonis]